MPDQSIVDGHGVTIAVLDTGVDAGHPDLAAAVDEELSESLAPLDARLTDTAGHGTHIAGIIAGDGSASEGRYRGIAPAARLVILKVSHWRGYADDVAAAVLRAIELDVHIINYSGGMIGWTAGGPPPWVWSTRANVLTKAFLKASEAGILCVAAAGNDGPRPGSVTPPATLREVLAVGALDRDGQVCEGSARGPVFVSQGLRKNGARYDAGAPGKAKRQDYTKPDLVAPGGDFVTHLTLRALQLNPGGVVSCRSRHTSLPGLDPSDPDSLYCRIGGTSQAAAVVSGVAALALQYARSQGLDLGGNPGVAVRSLLCKAARQLATGSHWDYGWGRLVWSNVAALIEDCVEDAQLRAAVLHGPRLELLED